MLLKLPEHLRRNLTRFTESHRGYHKVEVTFADGSFLRAVVLESRMLELPDDAKYIQEIVNITTR